MLRYLTCFFCLFLGLESVAKEKEYADADVSSDEKISKIREAQERDDFDAMTFFVHERALAYYRRILPVEIDVLKNIY